MLGHPTLPVRRIMLWDLPFLVKRVTVDCSQIRDESEDGLHTNRGALCHLSTRSLPIPRVETMIPTTIANQENIRRWDCEDSWIFL
jgi:hypothetical protein